MCVARDFAAFSDVVVQLCRTIRYSVAKSKQLVSRAQRSVSDASGIRDTSRFIQAVGRTPMPNAQTTLCRWRLLLTFPLRHGRACPGHPRLWRGNTESRGCPAQGRA
jgi:hypothetical protein